MKPRHLRLLPPLSEPPPDYSNTLPKLTQQEWERRSRDALERVKCVLTGPRLVLLAPPEE